MPGIEPSLGSSHEGCIHVTASHTGRCYLVTGGSRGIRVVGFLPGRISTDRIAEIDAAGDPRSRERSEERIPLRRYGTPAEFGTVAAFLLSEQASYVTGCLIPIDGGSLRAP